MADPKTTNRFVSTDSKFDFYANVISHAELYANNISANSFNVGSQTLEEYIQSVGGGGGGSGDVTNNYVTATFVSNNYLEDIKSTFGTGDVTNNYLTAIFSSNNYVQDILDTKATNTYVNSTFSSNNYIQDQLDLKATNTYVNSTFTSNNYVDGRFSSNTYVTSKIGLRATNTYVNSTFVSNNYLDGKFSSNSFIVSTFASNNYIQDHVATEVAALVDSAPSTLDTLNELAAALGDDANFATTITNKIGLRATNTYVNDTFSSNNYLQDQLDLKATNTYVNSTFTSNNYVEGRFVSNTYVTTRLGIRATNTYVQETFTSNNYVQDVLDTKATNTYVNSTFTSNNYVDGRFTSNSFVKDTFTSNNYVQTQFDLKATNTYVNSTFTSNNYVEGRFTSNNYVESQLSNKVSTTHAGDVSITGNVTITSTENGSSAGPDLILYRNSASPNDGDYIGQIQFKGRQDGPGDEIYAKVTGKIRDSTNGTEDGLIETAIKGNGTFTIVSRQRSDELQLLNGVGLSVDGSITVGGTVDGRDIASDGSTLDSISGTYASNNYLVTTFASNNYLQDRLTAFGNGDVTNNYLVATFTSNNYVQTQLGLKLNSSSYTAADVLTKIKTVDGAGSGLDADTLDGLQGSSYSSNNYITNHYTTNNYIQTFVAAEVAGIVDSAPAALDTLNELAAALGDDANFSTTVSNQIGLRATNTYVNSTFSSNNYLQSQLSTKLNSSSYTASDVLTKIKTVDGSGSGLDADLLDGQQGSYYLDWTNTTNKPDPVITLGGDLSGSVTLTDLASGTLTATIQPNSVALSIDTTGNYVATISGTTNEVEVSGSGSEGAGVTVGLPNDVTIGNDLTVTNDIIQTNHSFVSSTITTTSTSQTNLDTFSTSTYSGAEVNVTAISNGERHMTKILVVHDGTTAYATEYGSIFTNTSLATYDVDISSGSVRLRVTPASATSTVFNTSMMLIEN